ncbi:MAG: hypothetical protein LBM13_03785 [Candidatus Ancillula sp.]|jgi:aldose 1-epimerase|nr:hypothetical protein [Candidatus Ancillula sp.]
MSKLGNEKEIELNGSFGVAHLLIGEVGATLHQYYYITPEGDRVDITMPYGDQIAPASCGCILAPWPNRIEDGKYSFEGKDYQLPITEIWSNNASHGLVFYQNWNLEIEENRIIGRLNLPPTKGYPFEVNFTVVYSLEIRNNDNKEFPSLGVKFIAENTGSENAPFGLAFHPYFSTRNFLSTEAVLTLKAESKVSTTDRLLPNGVEKVIGTDFDLSSESKSLGERVFDTAFVDVELDKDNKAHVLLKTPDNAKTDIWGDSTFKSFQVFTASSLKGFENAVAVEPQTCYANAFNTGDLLLTLKPNQQYVGEWGLDFSK